MSTKLHALFLLGWKKSNEKNAWLMNKFIFLRFWTINFDAVFDNLFVYLFALTNLNEVYNFNNKNSNKHVWIHKITFFKMANSPVRNVRVEKRGNENWSSMRWFFFQKIDLLFDWNSGPNRPILRDIRGQNAGHKCDKKKLNHENGSTIDAFLNFLVQT